MTDQDQLIREGSGSSGSQQGVLVGDSTRTSPAVEYVAQKSVRKNGRYINPWPDFKLPSYGSLMKFLFVEKNNSNVPGKQELDVTLPIVRPNKEVLKTPPEQGIRVTWIGHATVLVQFDGLSILTDPIFSQRCAPVQLFGHKRYRDTPCSIHDLPKIDAVVISHNHYDHLDYNSVQTLNARFGIELRWFVPAGLEDWMRDTGCENVIQLDWWEENCIQNHPDVKFVFTPAKHWCKRGTMDDNKVLWGGWSVIGPRNRFYFAGDTGYCDVFKQIGHKYGPFDLAAIPIGAYEPRWFMKPQHVNPAEAVQIHEDVKAKKSLAIHWGTFNLSYEPYLEPPEKVKEAMKAKQLNVEDFFTLHHGQSQVVGENTGVD